MEDFRAAVSPALLELKKKYNANNLAELEKVIEIPDNPDLNRKKGTDSGARKTHVKFRLARILRDAGGEWNTYGRILYKIHVAEEADRYTTWDKTHQGGDKYRVFSIIFRTALQETYKKVAEKKEKSPERKSKKVKKVLTKQESGDDAGERSDQDDEVEKPEPEWIAIRAYAVAANEDVATTVSIPKGGRGKQKVSGVWYSPPADDGFVVHARPYWNFPSSLRRLAIEAINVQEFLHDKPLISPSGFTEEGLGNVVYGISGILVDLPLAPNTPISGSHVMAIEHKHSWLAYLNATRNVNLPTIIFRCLYPELLENSDCLRYGTRTARKPDINWQEDAMPEPEEEDGDMSFSFSGHRSFDYDTLRESEARTLKLRREPESEQEDEDRLTALAGGGVEIDEGEEMPSEDGSEHGDSEEMEFSAGAGVKRKGNRLSRMDSKKVRKVL